MAGDWHHILIINNKCLIFSSTFSGGYTIVIKPDPGVDPTKKPGFEFYGTTRINSGQPGSLGKIKNIYLKF
jgi:hypothetical protein